VGCLKIEVEVIIQLITVTQNTAPSAPAPYIVSTEERIDVCVLWAKYHNWCWYVLAPV